MLLLERGRTTAQQHKRCTGDSRQPSLPAGRAHRLDLASGLYRLSGNHASAVQFLRGGSLLVTARNSYFTKPAKSETGMFNLDPNRVPLRQKEASVAGSDSSLLASAQHQGLNPAKLFSYEITMSPKAFN